MKKLLTSLSLLAITLLANAYDAEVDGIYYNLDPDRRVAEVTYQYLPIGEINWSSDARFGLDGSDMDYACAATFPQDIWERMRSGTFFVTVRGDYPQIRVTSGWWETVWTGGDIYPGNERLAANGDGTWTLAVNLAGDPLADVIDAHDLLITGGGYTLENIYLVETNSGGEPGDEEKLFLWKNEPYHLEAVNIPEKVTYNGVEYTVTGIGAKAFRNCGNLATLTIPNSVTDIGSNSFQGCSGLTSLTFTNSVTNIGSYAFSGCSSLTSLTIPKSVTAIGYSAFEGCIGLTSIKVESGNTVYDSRENCNAIIETGTNTLFAGCKSSIIPNSVTTIGNGAFYNCRSLTSITIPNSVTTIGNSAFANCSGLASLAIPNSVTTIGDSAFAYCRSLTSLTIPNSVDFIAGSAFEGCSGLASVTIPNSVTNIGNVAFYGCSGLTEVTSLIEEPFTIDKYVWFGVNTDEIPLYVPAGCKEKYEATEGWNVFKNIVETGNVITHQCPDDNHPHMIDLGLPSGTKWACCNVGAEKPEDYGGYFAWGETEEKSTYNWTTYIHCDGSMQSCHYLGADIAGTNYDVAHVTWGSSWVMPNQEQINELVDNCQNEIAIENGILGRKFTGPNGRTIFLPAAGENWNGELSDIGKKGHYYSSNSEAINCANLLTFYVDNNRVVGDDEGYRAVGWSVRPVVAGSSTSSSNISFADPAVKAICVANWDTSGDGELSYEEAAAVTELGTVFKDNQEITRFDELQYFTSLKKISNLAFSTCYNLNAVTIPQSVLSIGNHAFYYCNKLKSITIPKSVTSIGLGSFDHCISLTSIKIPNSVTSLNNNPFEFCRVLTSIEVEEGNPVYDSREGCNAIIRTEDNTLVTGCIGTVIPNNVTTIGRFAFSGCENLESITIPNSVTSIEWAALACCYALKSVTISDNVESIGGEAFSVCKSLTSITLPKSVADIGESAFYGCENLNMVVSLIEEPFEINEGTFTLMSGAFTTATLSVPVGCKEKYEATPAWNKFANIVEMGASSGISIDETNFPDENFRNWVLAQDYGQDGVLTEAEIAGVMEIDVNNKNIASLKGIEYFTTLTSLYCYNNQLTSLDVSQNTALMQLRCYGNQLTSLDVSQNTALKYLECDSNQLTTLDVSNNTALMGLGCSYNQLTVFDVSQNTALTWLDCCGNQLTSLDVSKNTALTSLYCYNNQLTSLDVSKNTALMSLECDINQLTSLDLSQNTALFELNCGYNQLTTLSLSKNTALTRLTCSNNQLFSLDVSQNTALTVLFCSNNQLTSLDVSKNTALTQLECHKNQLTSLDVSQNTALMWLYCYYNKIKGTAMDGLIASLPETGGELIAIAPNDPDEQNIVTKAQVVAAKEKGWIIYTNIWDESRNKYEEYEGSEPEMEPIENGETINIGDEIDENTNLNGNVVDNVFVNISNGDGGFDPVEGCLIVSKPTEDSAINGKDIFGDDFKDNYTGIVFKVNEGKGSIKVEAETQGNMVLKVKIGNSDPIEMELDGKLKVKFPYNVSEETLVYIYGGLSDAAGAKGTRASTDGNDLLKIYGFEIVSDPSGIDAIEHGKQADAPVYNLNGQRVNTPSKGVYIKNGRKVIVK